MRFGRILLSYGIVFSIGLWLGYRFASTEKTMAPEKKELSESILRMGKADQGSGEEEGRGGETPSLEGDVVQKDDLSLTFYETLLKKEPPPKVQAQKEDVKSTHVPTGSDKRPGPPKEEKASKRTLPRGAPFSIQVGSFAHKEQADDLTQRLIDKGYPAYIRSQIISGMGRMYQVRVGHYQTLDEAKREAELIRRKEKLQTYVPSLPGR
jgi:cell division septation protein DedD